MDPTFPLLLLVAANVHGALVLRSAARRGPDDIRSMARGAIALMAGALGLALVAVAA